AGPCDLERVGRDLPVAVRGRGVVEGGDLGDGRGRLLYDHVERDLAQTAAEGRQGEADVRAVGEPLLVEVVVDGQGRAPDSRVEGSGADGTRHRVQIELGVRAEHELR